eukprot:evm.model.scf_38EXC.12 EVM.evm.TU.scf_38EXC.12   scf_38EXC:133811-136151(+)
MPGGGSPWWGAAEGGGGGRAEGAPAPGRPEATAGAGASPANGGGSISRAPDGGPTPETAEMPDHAGPLSAGAPGGEGGIDGEGGGAGAPGDRSAGHAPEPPGSAAHRGQPSTPGCTIPPLEMTSEFMAKWVVQSGIKAGPAEPGTEVTLPLHRPFPGAGGVSEAAAGAGGRTSASSPSTSEDASALVPAFALDSLIPGPSSESAADGRRGGSARPCGDDAAPAAEEGAPAAGGASPAEVRCPELDIGRYLSVNPMPHGRKHRFFFQAMDGEPAPPPRQCPALQMPIELPTETITARSVAALSPAHDMAHLSPSDIAWKLSLEQQAVRTRVPTGIPSFAAAADLAISFPSSIPITTALWLRHDGTSRSFFQGLRAGEDGADQDARASDEENRPAGPPDPAKGPQCDQIGSGASHPDVSPASGSSSDGSLSDTPRTPAASPGGKDPAFDSSAAASDHHAGGPLANIPLNRRSPTAGRLHSRRPRTGGVSSSYVLQGLGDVSILRPVSGRRAGSSARQPLAMPPPGTDGYRVVKMRDGFRLGPGHTKIRYTGDCKEREVAWVAGRERGGKRGRVPVPRGGAAEGGGLLASTPPAKVRRMDPECVSNGMQSQSADGRGHGGRREGQGARGAQEGAGRRGEVDLGLGEASIPEPGRAGRV